MESLPAELKARLCYFLHPRDACALRLVCKDLCPSATEQAFSTLTVARGNYSGVKNIVWTSLRNHVRHVIYRSMVDITVEDIDMDSEIDYIKYSSGKNSAELSATVLLGHLSRPPFLRKFSMIFHPHQSGWGDANADHKLLEQGIGDRIGLLWETFEALQGISSLRSLEIYNLQAVEEPDAEAFTKSRPFCTVLHRLESLRTTLISSFRCIPPYGRGDADYENFPHT